MISYSVFNYLITQDERFSAKAFETFNTSSAEAPWSADQEKKTGAGSLTNYGIR